jgi:oligopeptide/dipeptide ABC transporter ATP-binding protein
VTAVLDVHELGIAFTTPSGVLRAVDGVSFSLEPGGMLGVVGESGSGKSVLMRAILGLLPREAVAERRGSVHFAGTDLMQLEEAQLRRHRGTGIAMIFQDPMSSLNPVMRVGDQVAAPLRWNRKLSRRAARARAVELLAMVGIPEPEQRADEYPVQLSGGLRQRVMIAIALSCDPQVLIADEPTTALDVTVQAQILDLLDRVREERSMAVVLVTHDLGVVAEHTDAVLVMYAGRVAERSPTTSLFAEPSHHYTRALLDSVPTLESVRTQPLRAIEGMPPDLVALGAGCAFAPRCRGRDDRCEQEQPPLEEHLTRSVACWNPVRAAHPSEVGPR